MLRKLLLEIISFLFMLLFLYAAFSKVGDYQKFYVQVSQSPVLTGMGGWIAPGVLLLELLACLFLVVPRLRLIGLTLSCSLMIMFTTYIVIILNFSRHIPCSCGGILERLGWTEHLIFNSVFVLFGVIGVILQNSERTERRNVEGVTT